MGETTIEWTQRPGTVGKTWNVCRGCSYESPGCKNCYAARIAGRFSGPGKPYEGLVTIRPRKSDGASRHSTTGTQVLGSKALWNGEVRFVTDKLLDPLRWRDPATVFANSMSDMFHEGFTNEQIAAMYGVAYLTPEHTYQFLTKRPERRRAWMQWIAAEARANLLTVPLMCVTLLKWEIAKLDDLDAREKGLAMIDKRLLAANMHQQFPLPNVWEGTSVESDDYTNRIAELLMTPATIRFLSIEPMLGPVDMMPFFDPDGLCECGGEHGKLCAPGACPKDAPWRHTEEDRVVLEPETLTVRSATAEEIARGVSEAWPTDPQIHQVIVGCESGPGMRACNIEWIRELRDQCVQYGVAFFLKQAREHKEHAEGAELAKPPGTPRQGIRYGKGSSWKGSHGGVITLPYLDGKQWAEFPA